MRAPGGARLTRASPLLAQIKRCPRARPHDWTQCPFAHPVIARGGLPAARWCRPSRPRSLPTRPSPPRAGREGQAERPPEVPVLGDGLPRLQKGARRRTRGRHHNRAMPGSQPCSQRRAAHSRRLPPSRPEHRLGPASGATRARTRTASSSAGCTRGATALSSAPTAPTAGAASASSRISSRRSGRPMSCRQRPERRRSSTSPQVRMAAPADEHRNSGRLA